MRGFLSHLSLRPSCHACPSKNGKSASDISIADFWGIENIDAAFSDNQGVSMLLINTQKGKQLWESACTDSMTVKAYPVDALTQPQLFGPTNYSSDYDRFWRDYRKKGYRHVAAKYGGESKLHVFIRKVRNKLARL